MAVTAIVRFTFPEPKSPEAAKAAFEASAPLYRGVRGLVRKYYLLSEDGRTGGGVYLFDSREDADRLYDDAWRAGIRERLGRRALDRVFRIAGDRRQRRGRDLDRRLIGARPPGRSQGAGFPGASVLTRCVSVGYQYAPWTRT